MSTVRFALGDEVVDITGFRGLVTERRSDPRDRNVRYCVECCIDGRIVAHLCEGWRLTPLEVDDEPLHPLDTPDDPVQAISDTLTTMLSLIEELSPEECQRLFCSQWLAESNVWARLRRVVNESVVHRAVDISGGTVATVAADL